MKVFRLLFIITVFFTSSFTHAALNNLSSGDVDAAFKTLGSLQNFRALEPASSWSNVFGVSVGLAVQATSTTKAKTITSLGNLDDVPAYFPDAYIATAFQAPYGLGVEFGFIPALNIKRAAIEQYGGNLKWTFTDVFFHDVIPMDLAIRGGYTGTRLGYQQQLLGYNGTLNFSQGLWNFNISASRKFWIFEPYLMLGLVNQNASLNYDGPSYVTLLANTFGVRTGFEKSSTNFMATLGTQVHLAFFNITAQADYQFGLINFAAKLAVKF